MDRLNPVFHVLSVAILACMQAGAQSNPCTPSGKMQDGKRHGHWVECFGGGKYEGEYRNGQRHGWWTHTLDNGEVQHGLVMEGIRVGIWTATKPDGSIYLHRYHDGKGHLDYRTRYRKMNNPPPCKKKTRKPATSVSNAAETRARPLEKKRKQELDDLDPIPIPSTRFPSYVLASKVLADIHERCQRQLGRIQQELVLTCVGQEIEAFLRLVNDPDQDRDLIEACKQSLLSQSGWPIVEGCVRSKKEKRKLPRH